MALQYRSSIDKLVLNSGSLANADTCPCCECNCSGGNGPYQISVTISGAPTPRAYSCGSDSCSAPANCADVAATYVLDCNDLFQTTERTEVCTIFAQQGSTCGLSDFGTKTIDYVVRVTIDAFSDPSSFTVRVESFFDADCAAGVNQTCKFVSFVEKTYTYTYEPGESLANGNCPTGAGAGLQTSQSQTLNCCDVSGMTISASIV